MKATWTGRRAAVALLVVLVVVLGWMVLDGVGATNPVRDGLTGVVSPLQLVFSRAMRPLTDQLDALQRSVDLLGENQALMVEISEPPQPVGSPEGGATGKRGSAPAAEL